MQKSGRKKNLAEAPLTPYTGKVILIRPEKKKLPAVAKPKLVLISKRSKRIDRDMACAKCGVVHNPVWEYAESSRGRIAICTYCKRTKKSKVFVKFLSGSFEGGKRR
jgi:hypothetical protein